MVSVRIYLDSNVFISLVRDEIDMAFNLRGKDSEIFFALCAEKKCSIILSQAFSDEIKKVVCIERSDVTEMLKQLSVNYEEISIKAENERVSEIIFNKNIHYSDAVHTALAIKSNCNLIISWNKKDFVKVAGLIECQTPTEFIDKIIRHIS
ncbi:MAG: hypothetical protein COT15_01285 [Candidatus Diapherotrites archaeon CG08_land_8_20_14_0_20_34_12]|nr:MAG: hypothetical protein COT15_01285 [Candidatus Diapherotrites archaeon CG08_land_8_20_14_0_20_34_12]